MEILFGVQVKPLRSQFLNAQRTLDVCFKNIKADEATALFIHVLVVNFERLQLKFLHRAPLIKLELTIYSNFVGLYISIC